MLRFPQYAGERERETRHKETLLKNNVQSVHHVCSMNTFIQVLFRLTKVLTKVLTVLQCSFMSPYTSSQIYSLRNIFPTASQFLYQTGLPLHRSAYRFTYPDSPIDPNRSGPRLVQPIRPMLSLSLNTCHVLASQGLKDNWRRGNEYV